MTQRADRPELFQAPIAPPAPSAAVAIPWSAASSLPHESSDERWIRWTARGVSRDRLVKRRFQIIACVIAVGITAWVLVTM
jgi:hypothetical protein